MRDSTGTVYFACTTSSACHFQQSFEDGTIPVHLLAWASRCMAIALGMGEGCSLLGHSFGGPMNLEDSACPCPWAVESQGRALMAVAEVRNGGAHLEQQC